MAATALCWSDSAVVPGSWKAMPMLAVTGCRSSTTFRLTDCRHEMLGQIDDSVDAVDSLGQDQKRLAARPGYQGRSVEVSHQAPGSDQRDDLSPPRGISGVGGERVGRHR